MSGLSATAVAWAALALLLMAGEALAPGAFLLWMGIAAGLVFVLVLLVPDVGLLSQMGAFVLLSFAAILAYRRWFRGRAPQGDHPTLNRRAAQLIGREVVLTEAMAGGRGRVQIGDSFWELRGPDCDVGSRVRVIAADGMSLRVERL